MIDTTSFGTQLNPYSQDFFSHLNKMNIPSLTNNIKENNIKENVKINHLCCHGIDIYKKLPKIRKNTITFTVNCPISIYLI